ncbi:MAG TPA: DUF3857 domain-containing protein [Thermoanaerobaculia bacterium]|nr:DUF3857 domain-containing protein [Thermoanaerobaculia bacterium]
MVHRCLRATAPALLALALACRATAEAFPPITAEERALTAVAGQPNAPAVVLFRTGELRLMDPSRQDVSSQLVVHERLKILTAAGKDRGDLQVAHSGSFRLQSFAGRTVLPDGTVVPLPADAAFKRTTSRSRRYYVTAVAFPAVQVGAILDFQYTVRWDSIIFLDPWFFQDRVPVLHSEIVYEVPTGLQASVWRSDPMRAGIQSDSERSPARTRLRVWADHLPPVPEEAHGGPFADMSAQVMMIPTAFVTNDVLERLFESWPATCQWFYEQFYEEALRKDGAAARTARDLGARVAAAPPPAVLPASATAAATAPAQSLKRRQAAAVYAFVRDEIATDEANYVWLPRFSTVGAVLAARRGEPAEKALLLQAMLSALRIDSRLVWAADRDSGAVDMQVPNPAWFDRVLVAAQLDGERVFLDPTDPTLAAGHLDPGYEGTSALLFDHQHPEVITLPEAPFSDNVRRARLELTLDAGGRASGSGTLILLGQSAKRRLRWRGDDATPAAAWEHWLREEFPGFAVGGVAVDEALDEARVSVSWTLSQHPEEALGDQANLVASRPLGPVRQILPAGVKRLSPVVFDFAERSEVELTLRWAAGWQPDALPQAVSHQTAAGAVVTSVDLDAAGRTLVYRRRFDTSRRDATTGAQVKLLRALYEEAQKSDAQTLALSRRQP